MQAWGAGRRGRGGTTYEHGTGRQGRQEQGRQQACRCSQEREPHLQPRLRRSVVPSLALCLLGGQQALGAHTHSQRHSRRQGQGQEMRTRYKREQKEGWVLPAPPKEHRAETTKHRAKTTAGRGRVHTGHAPFELQQQLLQPRAVRPCRLDHHHPAGKAHVVLTIGACARCDTGMPMHAHNGHACLEASPLSPPATTANPPCTPWPGCGRWRAWPARPQCPPCRAGSGAQAQT